MDDNLSALTEPNPLLGTEGIDIAYVAVTAKFQLIQKWLHEERVLLLRSPPATGKTTFAMAFIRYLKNHGFKATYLNVSLPENMPNATRTMDHLWQTTFDSEMTFSEASQSVPADETHYVVLDESQFWYPANVSDINARQEVYRFWAGIKFHVQPALQFTDFLNAPYAAFPSITPRAPGVRLLCLAGYGEANVGSIGTPLAFLDPEDPETGSRLPLGLSFLRLNREFTNQLIVKFIEVMASQGKKAVFDSDVNNLIYEETNGHVGAIRAILSHLINSNRRSKRDVLNFIRQDVYQTDLNAFRTFLCVGKTAIEKLPSKDLTLLIECIVLFKSGCHEFRVEESQIVELVKLGIFVKTAATAVNGETTVAFPSPVHFDLVLHNILNRKLVLLQSRHCFEQLLKEMVLRISPKVMQDTTPPRLVPLECHWQDEVSRSFRTISKKVLKRSVGREFNQHAFLDLYINDGLHWGIELIRDGDGKRLEEHVGRFRDPCGRYRDIPMQQYALLNFTQFIPHPDILKQYDENVYHLVYNNEYTEVAVYRRGSVVEDWNIIGHQGRTEF